MSLKLETVWPDLYTTRVTAEDGFFAIILLSYYVTKFQPSSISKQFVGTGGNRYLLLKLDKLWRDHYTIKVNAAGSYLSVILNPRLLHCAQFSTLIKLKTSRGHRRESNPVT